MKQVSYFIEALGLYAIMLLFRILPLDMASGLGGWIGRTLGPRIGASKKALRNMNNVLPDLPLEDKQKIITGMWDNLGRVMAEYPHLKKIGRERVKIVNKEIIEELFNNDQPFMIISAHFGNWETACATLLMQYNKQLDATYRAPNNPWADKILTKARSLGGQIRAYPKSRSGGRDLIKAMAKGRTIGMMIDQKYNEGLAVPFFGKPAMTNPVFVQLGRKYGYPLIPVRAERTKGANFIMTIDKPLDMLDDSGNDLPVEKVITQAHIIMEHWIRGRPELWLWLHRRWDSKKLEEGIKEES